MRLAISGAVMAAMLAACATPAQAPVPAAPEVVPSVTRTHEFAMTSKRTGLKYVVLVSEPLDPVPAGAALPALYVTDGNWYFGMATDTARSQFIGGSMGRPLWSPSLIPIRRMRRWCRAASTIWCTSRSRARAAWLAAGARIFLLS